MLAEVVSVTDMPSITDGVVYDVLLWRLIVNDVLQDGRTALGRAIDGKHPDCAMILVTAGANVLTSKVSYSLFACTPS